ADLASALKLLALPRELGAHPDTGKKVIVNIGRFGPYIGHDGKFKSIPKTDSIFDIGLERAVELLSQARDGNTVLRTLGDHPDDKASVEICSGRYGPYVRHGKVNATLPKGISPDDLTMEEALELIAAKAAKGGGKARKPAAKKPEAKTTKTKAAKTTKAKTATHEEKAAPTRAPVKTKSAAKPAAVKAAKPATKKIAAKKPARSKG
ncbi:MAG: DNA topoisomerase I, partial [Gallionella sp.]|nr:DNA topoisomerase I [Gallionella sp.]